MLLDEADTFLESRSSHDLQRNALTSGQCIRASNELVLTHCAVFLRGLEYYNDILILTSNRVASFDEAFKSRIHLAIKFSPLDKAARKMIWRNFFESLRSQESDIDHPDLINQLDSFAHEPLNGRQIRNSIMTGLQIAAFQKCLMKSSHIWQVVHVAREFDQYLHPIGPSSLEHGVLEDEGLPP